MRRRAAGAAVAVAGMAMALLLSACGNDGLALARQACVHVNKSLALYAQAEHTADPQRAAAKRTQALVELELALPLAAQANSADAQWNPLMTTLQEAGTNKEANLVQALQAQCAVADSNQTQAPLVVPGGNGTATTPGTGVTPGTGGPAPNTPTAPSTPTTTPTTTTSGGQRAGHSPPG